MRFVSTIGVVFIVGCLGFFQPGCDQKQSNDMGPAPGYGERDAEHANDVAARADAQEEQKMMDAEAAQAKQASHTASAMPRYKPPKGY